MKLNYQINLNFIARPQKHLSDEVKNGPLVIAGLFQTANGIGEGARGTYNALLAAGLSPIAVDLSEELGMIDMKTDIPLSPMPEAEYGTLILQLNGPETAAALHHLNMRRGRKWYTIGYWAWELPTFPTGWEKAFPFLSEIWAVSHFTKNAIAQHPKAPNISVFGHAVSPPNDLQPDRQKFGLPTKAFAFLTLADSMSSLNRKNPFAAIAAFRKSFKDRTDVCLIVKTRNLERDNQALSDLHNAIEGSDNIILLDTSLSQHEIWELFASIDAVISFHRSEGFGLALAEAMALKKAVAATAWSGNMDFMTHTNSYLADYSLISCEDVYGVYNDTKAEWADVALDEAVRVLKELYQNPDHRKKIIDRAHQDILERANTHHLGKKIAQHIGR